MSAQQPRQNHHVNPRNYLRGFLAEQERNMIWRYQVGKPFEPGTSSVSNPRLMSTKEAGVLQQYYSFNKSDGTRDIDTVEKILAHYEGYGNRVLEHLRTKGTGLDQCALSANQKATFAGYVNLTLMRTPRRMEHAERLWQNAQIESSFAQWREMLLACRRYIVENSLANNYPFDRFLVDFERAAFLPNSNRLKQTELISNFRMEFGCFPPTTVAAFMVASKTALEERIPEEIRIRGVASRFLIGRVMRRMRWTFLLAPSTTPFFSSDNPVVLTEAIGFKNSDAELTFPISSSLVLYASWHRDLPEGYMVAPPSVVGEINGRTLANATNWAYGKYESTTVAHLVARPRPNITPIYYGLRGQ